MKLQLRRRVLGVPLDLSLLALAFALTATWDFWFRFVLLGAALLALVAWRRGTGEISPPYALLALLLWAGASVLWSANPGISLRWAIVLAAVSLAVFLVVQKVDPASFALALSVGLGGVSWTSIVIGVLFPNWRVIANSADYLRGFLPNSGVLAILASAGVITAGALAVYRPKSRLNLGAGAGSTLALMLTEGRTPALAVVAGLATLVLVEAWRRGGRARRWAVTTLILLALAAATVAVTRAWDPLFTLLGKSGTLSNRTPIWGTVLGLISVRPVQGWGLNGALSVGSKMRDEAFRRVGEDIHALDPATYGSWPYPFAHAHNGALDVALGLGVIGLAMVTVIFVQATRGALRVARDPRGDAWSLAILAYLLVINIAETDLISHSGLVLLVGTYSLALRPNTLGVLGPDEVRVDEANQNRRDDTSDQTAEEHRT